MKNLDNKNIIYKKNWKRYSEIENLNPRRKTG